MATQENDQGLPPISTVPQAGGSVVTKALGRTLLEKVPGISHVTRFLREANEAHQEERVEYWAARLVGDEDGDAFAARLDAAMKGPERATVRNVVLASAKSATEALDEIVIPTIALLTRMLLQTRTPTLRAYRRILSLLESIDAEVFKAIAEVIPKLVAGNQGKTVSTNFMFDRGLNDWNWYALFPNPNASNSITETLLRGDVARRVVDALVGETRGPFERDGFPAGPDGPKELMSSSEVFRPRFEPEVIELLSAIWFVPPER